MSRYFFHLSLVTGLLRDHEGSEHSDIADARTEALDGIRALAAEHLHATKPMQLRGIHICDSSGMLVAEVTVAEALADIIPMEILVSSR